MSYTVWSYDYEGAPHHANNLQNDTLDDFKVALVLAKTRCAETAQNTGWARVVDNGAAGRMGEAGIVATYHKTSATGAPRRSYLHENYRKLLWRRKVTSAGLLALHNKDLVVWEYYQSTGPAGADLRQTGSTLQFEH